MEFLLDRLGNPQRDFPSVIVAGTNGKGSVTVLLESIFSATGQYQVGSTTSPHLVRVTERIRIQNNDLSASAWVEGVKAMQGIVKTMEREPSIGAPTFFELVTALAFWAFRENDCDIAILEVGLGGRLDATNIVTPEIAIITNIGTDHADLLGPDKPSIAKEKLGILKKRGVLITGEKDPSILDIFQKTCLKRKAELIVSDISKNAETIESHRHGHNITLPGISKQFDFPLVGRHQIENLSVALSAVSKLRKNGFEISQEAVMNGIMNVRWPGRLQWFYDDPPVLIDGAHNIEGLSSLVYYLKEFPMPQPCNLILGVLRGKPASKIALSLAPFAEYLTFVPPSTDRALDFKEFETQIQPTDSRWVWCDDFPSALSSTRKSASILIAGSLYLVADFLKEHEKFKKGNPKK
ncbi:bifunctional folylpolyglutamate synthase/dihydrofolate synthase [bacterium]|nr:bifunctional folylpolyglutamate synthase/dihydrofolate synthase [bacterium]